MTGKMGRFLTASVGDRVIHFDVSQVDEVVECSILRHLPGRKEFISGLTSVKGKILPVLHVFQEPKVPFKGILFNVGGKQAVLSVDEVLNIVNHTVTEETKIESAIVESCGNKFFIRTNSILEGIV
ncbi:MAG TPA: chemotaxis protein CheW [Caldisericia bacterium]|nr:chemotaxis protein CheW [Caldisericia bacterium]HPF49687.1 chemotaxis protein CheW [Caldisericia bacterium]HPI84540.1 chemotaxis protein CheW [Caldisericia bacterium]HPQ93655.1 chemotaxis protein CheW [Caldisericia bacterium]HRV74781.1 chemotaxis protein CheW [Caldisericia bacterium]